MPLRVGAAIELSTLIVKAAYARGVNSSRLSRSHASCSSHGISRLIRSRFSSWCHSTSGSGAYSSSTSWCRMARNVQSSSCWRRSPTVNGTRRSNSVGAMMVEVWMKPSP